MCFLKLPMTNESEDAELRARQIAARINRALGLFLLFFGLIVLSAAFFTSGLAGQLINVACAAVIGGIGAGMILRSRRIDRDRPV